jgi:hypothetical protein
VPSVAEQYYVGVSVWGKHTGLRGWRIWPVVIVTPSIPAGEKAQLLANRLRFCFRHSISGKDNRESKRGVEEGQATTNIKQEATHDRSGKWAMGR